MNWPQLLIAFPLFATVGLAQQTPPVKADPMQKQLEQLTAAVAQEQAEPSSSRSEIQQLRREITELRADVAAFRNDPHEKPSEQDTAATAAELRSEMSALREQADVEQSEIAVHVM